MIIDFNEIKSASISEILNEDDNSLTENMFKCWKTEFPNASDKFTEEISDGKNGFFKWLLEKHENLDSRERENMFEAINHIKSLYTNKAESEICIKGRIWILQNLGPMRYHAWFHMIGLKHEGGDRLTYHGSNFMTDMTLQRYGDALSIDQYEDIDIKHFLKTTADF